MSLDERKKRRRALDTLGVPSFGEFLELHRVAGDISRLGIYFKPALIDFIFKSDNVSIMSITSCCYCPMHVRS